MAMVHMSMIQTAPKESLTEHCSQRHSVIAWVMSSEAAGKRRRTDETSETDQRQKPEDTYLRF